MGTAWTRAWTALWLVSLVCAGLAWEADAAQLTLTWTDNANNENGFKIEQKIGTGGTFAQVATVGSNVVTYTNSGLTAGTSYCYRVRAYNTAGNSGYSNEGCGTPGTALVTLTVARAGSGSGAVSSTPAGIACGLDCSESYSSGSIVTLTASPASGSMFAGWSGGACSGTGNCALNLTATASVTATFIAQSYVLSVAKTGTGSGAVSGPGITCGTDCSEMLPSGSVVTLSAGPVSGSTFAGWSGGACAGTGTCTLTLAGATAVTAVFSGSGQGGAQSHTLSVTRAGSGSGTVAGPGIACGTDCRETLPGGSRVALTANALAGSTFAGWSGGACSGTGSCTLSLAAPLNVTATFQKDSSPPVGGLVTGPGPGHEPRIRTFSVGIAPSAPSSGFMAYDAAFAGGVFVAAGVVEGVVSIVTGAGPGGGPHVRTFDLATGDAGVSFMAYDPAFRGGVRVASCDVDGDGSDEIVTVPGPGGGPHVRVFKLTTGDIGEVAGYLAYEPAFAGGLSVACGDLDADGRAEIITGAGPGGGPHVRAWKVNETGVEELVSFFAYNTTFAGGVFVGSGDVDGDGRAEIVTGPGAGGGPHVRVWRMTAHGTVTELVGFFAYDPGFAGGVSVSAGNLEGQGRADVITGAGPGGGPHVRTFRTANAAVVEGLSLFAYEPGFTGGITVSGTHP